MTTDLKTKDYSEMFQLFSGEMDHYEFCIRPLDESILRWRGEIIEKESGDVVRSCMSETYDDVQDKLQDLFIYHVTMTKEIELRDSIENLLDN